MRSGTGGNHIDVTYQQCPRDPFATSVDLDDTSNCLAKLPPRLCQVDNFCGALRDILHLVNVMRPSQVTQSTHSFFLHRSHVVPDTALADAPLASKHAHFAHRDDIALTLATLDIQRDTVDVNITVLYIIDI